MDTRYVSATRCPPKGESSNRSRISAGIVDVSKEPCDTNVLVEEAAAKLEIAQVAELPESTAATDPTSIASHRVTSSFNAFSMTFASEEELACLGMEVNKPVLATHEGSTTTTSTTPPVEGTEACNCTRRIENVDQAINNGLASALAFRGVELDASRSEQANARTSDQDVLRGAHDIAMTNGCRVAHTAVPWDSASLDTECRRYNDSKTDSFWVEQSNGCTYESTTDGNVQPSPCSCTEANDPEEKEQVEAANFKKSQLPDEEFPEVKWSPPIEHTDENRLDCSYDEIGETTIDSELEFNPAATSFVLQPASAPETAAVERGSHTESKKYQVGSRVEVWSQTESKWFVDGTIQLIDSGWAKIAYKHRTRGKWAVMDGSLIRPLTTVSELSCTTIPEHDISG
jgi:hypothetical protein